MATKRTNGRNNLEEAVAMLINNQAQFLGVVARIENEFAEIKNILIQHQQTLNALPEAIREKIGFKNR